MSMMSAYPLISILMPVYNGACTITRAINSIKNQTYLKWNCIIVNDGSIDETLDLVLSQTDERFVVIDLKENRGRGYARQICLENATGDFITYLDADDFLHPRKLEAQINTFLSNPIVDLVSHSALTFDKNDLFFTFRGARQSEQRNYTFKRNLNIVLGTSMIKRDLAVNITYRLDLNASEDKDYFSKYLNNRHFYVMSDILLYYYQSPSLSLKKILSYHFNDIEYYKKCDYLNFKIKLWNITIVLIKILIIPLLYLLSKQLFIKRRGTLTSQSEIDEYKIIKSKCNG